MSVSENQSHKRFRLAGRDVVLWLMGQWKGLIEAQDGFTRGFQWQLFIEELPIAGMADFFDKFRAIPSPANLIR